MKGYKRKIEINIDDDGKLELSEEIKFNDSDRHKASFIEVDDFEGLKTTVK